MPTAWAPSMATYSTPRARALSAISRTGWRKPTMLSMWGNTSTLVAGEISRSYAAISASGVILSAPAAESSKRLTE